MKKQPTKPKLYAKQRENISHVERHLHYFPNDKKACGVVLKLLFLMDSAEKSLYKIWNNWPTFQKIESEWIISYNRFKYMIQIVVGSLAGQLIWADEKIYLGRLKILVN